MKRNFLLPTLLLLALAAFFTNCDKKGITDPVTLDRAAGKWTIHAIRYRIFENGSSTSRDSTVPWNPVPENAVTFDGKSALQYVYNNSGLQNGTYSFIGEDSIEIRLNNVTRRWKILLLTGTNFNIEYTSTNNTSFPGAKVITYQGFIR